MQFQELIDKALYNAKKIYEDRIFSGVISIDAIKSRCTKSMSPLTNDINELSKFMIGSISKQITATIVLQEVDSGNIDLDDSILEYLSGIKFFFIVQAC